MLSIAPPPTIFLHTSPTDMRKSFDGLTGLVRGAFGSAPTDVMVPIDSCDRCSRTLSKQEWPTARASRATPFPNR